MGKFARKRIFFLRRILEGRRYETSQAVCSHDGNGVRAGGGGGTRLRHQQGVQSIVSAATRRHVRVAERERHGGGTRLGSERGRSPRGENSKSQRIGPFTGFDRGKCQSW